MTMTKGSERAPRAHHGGPRGGDRRDHAQHGSVPRESGGLFGVRWRELRGLWKALVEREPFPQVDRWLSEEFRRNAKYGSRDRKWYAEMMFAAVRYGLLAPYMESSAGAPGANAGTPAACDLGRTALADFGPRFSDIETLQSAWRTLPPETIFAWVLSRQLAVCEDASDFSDALRAVVPSESERNRFLQTMRVFLGHADCAAKHLATLTLPDENTEPLLALLFLRSGIPLWYVGELVERWRASQWTGAKAVAFLECQNSRPPLWLRLNDLSRAEDVLSELDRESFATLVEGEAGEAVRATGAKGIFATTSYRDGLFEIQDLASQRIGRSVQNKPGDFVWDCCAGGGGKTMQIASRAKNKGVVYASDVREYKLEEVKKRARRAGFFNIRCVPWQGEALPPFPKEIEKRAGFDWVLVDAPCSSSGTWRRNPDAKYRTLRRNIDNLGALQMQLLARASLAVRPGGSLVYSTCSWIVDENEGIARRFLAENPAFSLVSQELFGAPGEDADTMFAAVFFRNT